MGATRQVLESARRAASNGTLQSRPSRIFVYELVQKTCTRGLTLQYILRASEIRRVSLSTHNMYSLNVVHSTSKLFLIMPQPN
jgi:hypothetical protein